ncbi:MAG: P-type conjugative transfer protein TrbJ [Pseudomonas sp.]
MNKPITSRWIHGLFASLPFQAAVAGIPVFDGANTSQTAISAIQNVAAVAKQIEQYKIQLEQYQNMLENTAAPAAYIWDQADQTISKLLTAQDTLSYYKAQAGSLERYLYRYQDTAFYNTAPCVGLQGCTAQDQQAIANAQVETSSARKRANDALLRSVANQQETLQADADALASIQRQATTATGRMQAIQSANQLASAQTNQLLQIRSLLVAQQNAIATDAQVKADREAQNAVADKRVLSGDNSPSTEQPW